ncbi:hypothetical protein ACFWIN_37015 [Streptomyces sp. NPDC127049]|uniref:hypothetical protein n=1 Tax=Streptomyces sp. NPDC127049 TaxID=3347118 RepID=UPI003662B4F8
MIKTAFQAQPTDTHHILKELHSTRQLHGPAVQHNFDLLAARAGLPECLVRRYHQKVPPIPIEEQAKAPVVVGPHADHRAVQTRARDHGMKVFSVDPQKAAGERRVEAVPDRERPPERHRRTGRRDRDADPPQTPHRRPGPGTEAGQLLTATPAAAHRPGVRPRHPCFHPAGEHHGHTTRTATGR